MNWFGYLLVVYWSLNIVLSVSYVNRRFTYTPGIVTFMVGTYLLLIWGVTAVGTTP